MLCHPTSYTEADTHKKAFCDGLLLRVVYIAWLGYYPPEQNAHRKPILGVAVEFVTVLLCEEEKRKK